LRTAVFLRSGAGKEEELARRLEALVLASSSDHSADPALRFLYERYESQEHFRERHRRQLRDKH